jgi:hypothetical protein
MEEEEEKFPDFLSSSSCLLAFLSRFLSLDVRLCECVSFLARVIQTIHFGVSFFSFCVVFEVRHVENPFFSF